MEELDAVREYLALEYADTSKKFQIEYDLQYTNFLLPQLSVEPLVENALKHGVDRYSPDACVKIISYLQGDCAVVEIRDNGGGFDLNSETFGKNSIGLKNTISRLKLMCGGTLDVSRQAGWTVIIIRIPNERSDS
jgi:LytS/YehU family sensor histidine kinase